MTSEKWGTGLRSNQAYADYVYFTAARALICTGARSRRQQGPRFVNRGRGKPEGGGMPKTVMIVEDNELNMKLFHDLLEAHGYETVGTRNGIG